MALYNAIWHCLALSGTFWHYLALSGIIWVYYRALPLLKGNRGSYRVLCTCLWKLFRNQCFGLKGMRLYKEILHLYLGKLPGIHFSFILPFWMKVFPLIAAYLHFHPSIFAWKMFSWKWHENIIIKFKFCLMYVYIILWPYFSFKNSFKRKMFCHDLNCSKTISFREHKAYKEPLIFCFISPVRKAVTTSRPRPCQPSWCQPLQASSAAMASSSIMSTPGVMR